MKHSESFLQIVGEAKKHVKETTVDAVAKQIQNNEKFIFVDVREDEEWKQGRAKGAIHLGKGVIERDIEAAIPDKNQRIILYCGGGFRSALAAEAIQKMGYKNVLSMDGGIRVWREKGLPEEK